MTDTPPENPRTFTLYVSDGTGKHHVKKNTVDEGSEGKLLSIGKAMHWYVQDADGVVLANSMFKDGIDSQVRKYWKKVEEMEASA